MASVGGTLCARATCMIATCVEELMVYQKALDAADEISAYLGRHSFREDPKLRDQLSASSDRVAASISEGFGQHTDRHFAKYLVTSRGSSKETRTHLRIARGRGYLTGPEQLTTSNRYDEIEKMLTGLIKHLRREDRKWRG